MAEQTIGNYYWGSSFIIRDLDILRKFGRLDFELPEMYRQMHEKYFAFQDNENSKRICEKVFDKMI